MMEIESEAVVTTTTVLKIQQILGSDIHCQTREHYWTCPISGFRVPCLTPTCELVVSISVQNMQGEAGPG